MAKSLKELGKLISEQIVFQQEYLNTIEETERNPQILKMKSEAENTIGTLENVLFYIRTGSGSLLK